jgi:hypothetical protein
VANALLGGATASAPVAVTVDNTPPTVSLTSPGATNLRDLVHVAADSADATSGVSNVLFQRSPTAAGTWTAIGTDSTAPYGVDLNTAALVDGLYDVRAVSTDVAGNTAVSGIRTVRIDNTAPTVAVSAPLESATVTGAMPVRADASDSGSGVQTVRFERSPIDENEWVEIGTDSTSPYEALFDTSLLADGVFELRVTVTDALGHQVTALRSVTLDNTLYAPTIGFFDFVNAFASDGVVYFKPGTSGGFSVGAEPDLFADPAYLDFPVLGGTWTGGGADATPPYEAAYTFDASAATLGGSQEVSIVENSGLRSAASPFGVVADGTPPTTTVTCNATPCAPWYNAPVSVSLRSTDTGAGVARTRYTTDGSDPGLPNAPVFAGPFSLTGSTTVRARSYDALGNEEPVSVVEVRIDQTPPSGSLTAPAAGQMLPGPTALLTADASDTGSGVSSVRFQQRRAGSETFADVANDQSAPFEATWTLSGLVEDDYELRFVVTDNAGNSSFGSPTAVTYASTSSSGSSSGGSAGGGSSTLSVSSSTPRVSASRSSALIVLSVRTEEQTVVRSTLLRRNRRVFTWRTHLPRGSKNLRLSLPRRVLRPGRYVLRIAAAGPSGKVMLRITFRAGRL